MSAGRTLRAVPFSTTSLDQRGTPTGIASSCAVASWVAGRVALAVVLNVGFGEAVVAEEDFPGYPDEYDHAHAQAHATGLAVKECP